MADELTYPQPGVPRAEGPIAPALMTVGDCPARDAGTAIPSQLMLLNPSKGFSILFRPASICSDLLVAKEGGRART